MKFHTDGTLPQEGEIFVFGSNLAGIHGKGAALIARKLFDAELYVGKGFTSNCSFAIPTKDGRLRSLSSMTIKQYVDDFCLNIVPMNYDEEFFVTRIGCGLAGFKDEDIAPMFAEHKDNLSNCSFAEEWKQYFKEETYESY